MTYSQYYLDSIKSHEQEAGRTGALADPSSQEWTLLPGQVDCCLEGIEVDTRSGGNCLQLQSDGLALSLEGRSGTPLFCELDKMVREGGEGKAFHIRLYNGMLRLAGPYHLQRYDRRLASENGQALRFQADFTPADAVRVLKRPCSGHPDFGLWVNPALNLLEYWWRDRLVTAIDLEDESPSASWCRQVVSYLEETAAASHAAVTFLAQLHRLGAAAQAQSAQRGKPVRPQ